jgi:hypothetical protein
MMVLVKVGWVGSVDDGMAHLPRLLLQSYILIHAMHCMWCGLIVEVCISMVAAAGNAVEIIAMSIIW